ncbi:hypothetical protein F8388_021067 [Cannabis sativa]|uniref:Uncharacterized protein n=1 Tax=Cannabis sativa TaxID=3483 RepID=A0A7J6GZ76_CANSA|nr:hypothetical protein F8388_021067 [Cannabis sativa]
MGNTCVSNGVIIVCMISLVVCVEFMGVSKAKRIISYGTMDGDRRISSCIHSRFLKNCRDDVVGPPTNRYQRGCEQGTRCRERKDCKATVFANREFASIEMNLTDGSHDHGYGAHKSRAHQVIQFPPLRPTSVHISFVPAQTNLHNVKKHNPTSGSCVNEYI